MTADPTTKRARNVVAVVILTVAVPSLLLTALGAVAVENEEAAAKRRLQQVYSPVIWEVAQRFNARIDQLLIDSSEPFAELVAFSQDEASETPALTPFVEKTGDIAINYFVLAPDGDVLVPRTPANERATEPLPSGMERALRHELAHYASKSACAEWTQIGDSCTDQRCAAEVARSMCRVATGRPDPYEFSDTCAEYAGEPVAKAALKIAALEREHADRLLEAAHDLNRMSKDSIQMQAPPPSLQAAEKLVDSALELVRTAKSPTARVSSLVSDLAAERMLIRLESDRDPEATCARDLLRSVRGRSSLLGQLASFGHPRDTQVQIQTVETDNWRRLIMTQSIDGYLVGFELVPCAFQPLLDAGIAEKELEDHVTTRLYPIQVQVPKEWSDYGEQEQAESEGRIGAWLLLKKTNLAWRLVVMLEDRAGFISVTRSRSTLYFWALILIAGALVAGIGSTVRTVSNEARLARLKTDFVSSVSHDLRTPLTSIRMFTETLLLGRASTKEEETEFLKVIADETDRLSRLTERILDFSRMEAGRKAYQFVTAEVPELVRQALRACRPMIEDAKFEVNTEYAAGLPSIEVDRDAIVEVLINLISNAIKYSPGERSICIAAHLQGDRMAISVTDRGIGIAKAEQAKIFEKFYRVDSRRASEVGGSGLGLSLVHHIVSAHGGEVTVESAQGFGSTFTVWLEVGPWRASSS